MDPDEYALMYRSELSHWWYLGMQDISRAILEKYYSTAHQLRILDAGCGTGGAMVALLPRFGNPIGVDKSRLALDYCRSRQIRLVACACVSEIPLRSQWFDLITSFDVLSAIDFEEANHALGEFTRLLVPGGRIMLRLPAYQCLQGQHDRKVHNVKRYTKRDVRKLLVNAGLRIEHLTYANTILFPLIAVKRLSEHLFPLAEARSDLLFQSGLLNRFWAWNLKFEAGLATSVCLPFGLSVVAVGRKPFA